MRTGHRWNTYQAVKFFSPPTKSWVEDRSNQTKLNKVTVFFLFCRFTSVLRSFDYNLMENLQQKTRQKIKTKNKDKNKQKRTKQNKTKNLDNRINTDIYIGGVGMSGLGLKSAVAIWRNNRHGGKYGKCYLIMHGFYAKSTGRYVTFNFLSTVAIIVI